MGVRLGMDVGGKRKSSFLLRGHSAKDHTLLIRI